MSSYRETYGRTAEELQKFLRVADRYLKGPARMVVIGGSAACLGYGAKSVTTDIDTCTPIGVLEEAFASARIETGHDIPLAEATIADFPYHYESRLVRVLNDLEKLEVWVLEKHDLALSKAVRCTDHDLQQLREIHDAVPLDLDTLVDRFRLEMDHVLGDRESRRANFLDMIESLFGEMKRVAVERDLPSHRW